VDEFHNCVNEFFGRWDEIHKCGNQALD
jgi:hypothetical protein